MFPRSQSLHVEREHGVGLAAVEPRKVGQAGLVVAGWGFEQQACEGFGCLEDLISAGGVPFGEEGEGS
jgi:hypothetical protein